MAGSGNASTVTGMRRFVIMSAALLTASAVLSATPAAAAGERYTVESAISLHIVDKENWPLEDQHCGFGGRTSQELVQSGNPAQLGTGTPGVSYHWNRGPFRDSLDRAISYFCDDEVSVCFHPARVTVAATGAMSITLQVKLFEGDGDLVLPSPLPCWPDDEIDSRSITLNVPAGTRACMGQNVQLGHPNGDRVAIGSFCASATLAGPPPPPPPVQPVISDLDCDSLTARINCDLSFTDTSGTATSIRWHINGTEISALNNRTTINRTCPVGTTVSVRAVVSNAGGGSAQRSVGVPCMSNAN
jgi:hypothetical protein